MFFEKKTVRGAGSHSYSEICTPRKIYLKRCFMSILRCPVCRQPVETENRTLRCENNHCFDFAKEGYVNLLLSGKSGDDKGDNREMARSRRDFLTKGYFDPLANEIGECVRNYTDDGDAVLDICCGEGYYTDFLAQRFSRDFYGFDISKNMVRLAGKRHCSATFFVANISSIPVEDGSVKLAFHLFAPFHSQEFSRVLSDDGVIVTAVAGRNHLYGLKSVLYDTPYRNDELPPQAEGLELLEVRRAGGEITLNTREDIDALFRMTPYYYHTPSAGMVRLQSLESLSTEIEFVIYVYRKKHSE